VVFMPLTLIAGIYGMNFKNMPETEWPFGYFAVLGLMAVMQNLADPSKLGHGIAAAFVATIYGIGLANLFFLPMASKLKVAIAGLSESREMVIEGMIGIAQGENPRSIEAKLQGYLH